MICPCNFINPARANLYISYIGTHTSNYCITLVHNPDLLRFKTLYIWHISNSLKPHIF